MKKTISTVIILLIIAFIWSVLYYKYTTPINQTWIPSKCKSYGYLCA